MYSYFTFGKPNWMSTFSFYYAFQSRSMKILLVTVFNVWSVWSYESGNSPTKTQFSCIALLYVESDALDERNNRKYTNRNWTKRKTKKQKEKHTPLKYSLKVSSWNKHYFMLFNEKISWRITEEIPRIISRNRFYLNRNEKCFQNRN